MTDRREFLSHAAHIALLGAAPAAAAVTAGPPPLPGRRIPGTEQQLSVVGLGNSQAFRSGDEGLSARLVDLFLEHGGGYVDTSGDARLTVGELLRARRAGDRLFLGSYLDGDSGDALRAELAMLADVQGGGALDLALSNDPDRYTGLAGEFAAMKHDGLVRYIGVARSGRAFFPAVRKLIEAGSVDVVQVNYSILEPEAADEILPLAQDAGVAVVINRPFINGRYFEIVRGRELPAWAAEFDCTSWAQFSLKYILANPAVTCVLTETTNPQHLADNLAAGYGRLPDDDMRQAMRGVMREMTG